MAFSAHALDRIEQRALDVELLDRLGFASETRRWPIEQGGARTVWRDVEALLIPFFRNGELVRRKFKAWEPPEGAPPYLQDKGGLRIAFNEDCLRNDALIGQPLIITEGELDAVAAIQSGFPRTISIPDGAPPPGRRDRAELLESAKYAWLTDIRPLLDPERVKEIILATDGDDNGAALMQDLSILLGRFRCKYLRYPKALPRAQARLGRERCKDLNEVLQVWGPKGVVETLHRAEWIRVAGVYRMSELPPLPPRPVYQNSRLATFGSKHYRVRLGDFVVITGVPGLGKTTFATDFYCQVAYEHELRIAWASFEQETQTDHRRALRSWWGEADLEAGRHGKFAWKMTPAELEDADAWIDRAHVFIVPSEDDDVTLDWMLDRMEAAVMQHGVKIIVIDPWNEMEHRRDRDETMTEYVGRAIRQLKRFARKFQVHLVVVAHPTKSTKDDKGRYRMPTLYDISDSANWYNKCDLGVIVHRENETETEVKVQKSKYHEIIGEPGVVVMQYSREQRRFIETGSIT